MDQRMAPTLESKSTPTAIPEPPRAAEDACRVKTVLGRPLVVTAPGSDVFLYPEVRPVALARLSRGSVAPIQRMEGDWFLIQFEDQRWGTRVGYVHCATVALLPLPQTGDRQASAGSAGMSPVHSEPEGVAAPTAAGLVGSTVRAAPTADRRRAPKKVVSLSGYVEWRRDGYLVADGQRVRWDKTTRLKLERVRAIDEAPIGSEITVKGFRLDDGSVLAQELELKPNGIALYEREVISQFNTMEDLFTREGLFFNSGPKNELQPIGKLLDAGPEKERVTALLRRLAPAYVDSQRLRVHIVQTRTINAAAAPNGSIWVFTGLLDDMRSDDELAIVLGHELAHYTHEHSRRQMKQGMWQQLAAIGAAVAIDRIKSPAAQELALHGARLGLAAWKNGYSRNQEDQADRVGLRYAHEAGFDVEKAVEMWQRQLQSSGQLDPVSNFFLGNHSRPSDRIRNIERELQFNYRH